LKEEGGKEGLMTIMTLRNSQMTQAVNHRKTHSDWFNYSGYVS